MTSLRALIIGFAGALACVAGAEAADAPQSWSLPPAPDYAKPAPQYRELMSGWYLRGDFGYRWNKVGIVESTTPVIGQKFSSTPGITLGAGYKYQWFRMDATIDRGLSAKFNGTTAAAVTQPQYTAKITTLSALANAYIDIGTWAGFTPYFGGGAGVTQLRSVGYTDTNFLTGAGAPTGSRVNFSWAWMAGVAFQIQPNWLVDVGFRHLDMGRVSNSMGTGLPADLTTFNKLTAQEVRIGFRYLFD
jgi:opacity protein-like surface antigen